jgi:hypothetical protein
MSEAKRGTSKAYVHLDGIDWAHSGHVVNTAKSPQPKFELQGNFTRGLFGRSDPNYPAVRSEWLSGLVRKGIIEQRLLSLAEASDDLMDDDRQNNKYYKEADSRLNWRVTFQHGDYRIHIMALDRNFQRFALSLHTENYFLESTGSRSHRPLDLRYEVVNRLSELRPILDDIYATFKRQEEERRQQDRIDEAVAKEREKWVERLAKEREPAASCLLRHVHCGLVRWWLCR